jgi:acyl-ACP thioesterase
MVKTACNSKVMFSDCDPKGRFKLSSMLRSAVEVAEVEYAKKGLSHEFLRSQNMVFLVSQLSLKIISFPQNQTNYVTKTWENGKKGGLFLRGLEILNETGEVLIQGVVGWILINTQTKKIMRPLEFPYPQPQHSEVFECKPLGRISYDNLTELGERIVRFSDLDINNHVNNAVYADVAVDFLPEPFYQKSLTNFRINFSSEVFLDDKIKLYGAEIDGGYVIVGKKQDRISFETEFIF